MSTLSDLFDQITVITSVGHAGFEVVVQWDRVHSVYVVYCLSSCSWCYASTKEEVIEMISVGRALASGWRAIGRRALLPAPSETACCEACGWLFWKCKGYYEPAQYAYCADCCSW